MRERRSFWTSTGEGRRTRNIDRAAGLILLASIAVAPAGSDRLAAQAPGPAAPPAGTPIPPPPPARPTFKIPAASSQVVVDGKIDEGAWQGALRLELPFEVHPGENVPAAAPTEAFLTYDAEHIYAAFKAHDPDPSSIRARLTDRDSAFLDDFVGIVVDTFNDERRAFEFFVNPMGVQMDLVVDDVAGNEDSSWDAIWRSAGALDNGGYSVEMAIPYTSLRFQRGEGAQVWGLDLIRIYPRDRRFLFAMNRRDRNVDCYLCQVAKVEGFDGAAPGANLEVTPTVTAIRTDALDAFPGGRLESGDAETEAGLTVKWGITPNLTMAGTVNPDFSQVEADVAQLEVNEQFALFFPEKRPFFLEGSDFFDTPMRAVYTRTVADPAWGAKLSGKEGKNVLGAFVAQDDVTNFLFPGSQGSSTDSINEKVTAGVFRYRRDVGKNSALGALFTARSGSEFEGEEYENGVLGVDALLRPSQSDTIRAQVLGSRTDYADAVAAADGQPPDAFTGRARALNYFHGKRNYYLYADYRDLTPEFRADMGFIPQVGFRRPEMGYQRRWWGEPGDLFSQIGWGGNFDQTVDFDGVLIERETETSLNFQGPRQLFLNVGGGHRQRGCKSFTFDQQFGFTYVELEPTRDLRFSLELSRSKRIDFAFEDPADPNAARQGDEVGVSPWMRYNLGRHVRLELSHTMRRLENEDGYLFRANLSELRLACQMSVRMFFRAIVQLENVARNLNSYPVCADDTSDPNTSGDLCPFESRSRDLFAQLLYSYKINPQTALFVGYTDRRVGLHGHTFLDTTSTVVLVEDFPSQRTDRTLFFKIGRAFVF